ncbi:MAG: thiamine phosphate synthase, partial [Bryobacteraceae bacterium]
MTLPRVYPIVDTAALEARGMAVETAARALIDGGARILQLRHKGRWPRELFEEARRIRGLCRERDVECIINDRADFALMLDAGLHLGQEDLTPSDARRVVGSRCIGFSTHNEIQLRAAAGEPVDYVALGPIFATGSKDKPDPAVGVERLREWRRLSPRPLVAIGGITRATARTVLDAGA